MIRGKDERIQGDVSGRLSSELPDDAAQIQVDVTSRWPAPWIPLKPAAGPKASPRALRAWFPS